MFDVNPDAAKFYFKDLERQVAASRRPRGVSPVPAARTSGATGSDSLVTLCSRLSARVFASALRGMAAVLF
jgi:hypothetical protein